MCKLPLRPLTHRPEIPYFVFIIVVVVVGKKSFTGSLPAHSERGVKPRHCLAMLWLLGGIG